MRQANLLSEWQARGKRVSHPIEGTNGNVRTSFAIAKLLFGMSELASIRISEL